jgi:hypothetical protein
VFEVPYAMAGDAAPPGRQYPSGRGLPSRELFPVPPSAAIGSGGPPAVAATAQRVVGPETSPGPVTTALARPVAIKTALTSTAVAGTCGSGPVPVAPGTALAPLRARPAAGTGPPLLPTSGAAVAARRRAKAT